MKYLKKHHIVLINRKTVQEHGGNFLSPFNFLKEDSLNYLIEAAEAEMFEQKLYPKPSDVAGLYMHSIISNHVFQDGNKRTGLLAALTFLNLNGFQIKRTQSLLAGNDYDHSYEFTLKVASGKVSLEDCQSWFEKNIISL